MGRCLNGAGKVDSVSDSRYRGEPIRAAGHHIDVLINGDGRVGPDAYQVLVKTDCKGCGLCAAECPCGAKQMVAETI